jgi:hypothetical protein
MTTALIPRGKSSMVCIDWKYKKITGQIDHFEEIEPPNDQFERINFQNS